jgi:hypothetical protein
MDVRQREKDRAVRQIWPGDDIFNAIASSASV